MAQQHVYAFYNASTYWAFKMQCYWSVFVYLRREKLPFQYIRSQLERLWSNIFSMIGGWLYISELMHWMTDMPGILTYLIFYLPCTLIGFPKFRFFNLIGHFRFRGDRAGDEGFEVSSFWTMFLLNPMWCRGVQIFVW